MAKILFLEDEPNLVETLPAVLMENHKKLEVTGTTSITDAFTRLASEEFDAVLLDISMPPTDDMDENSVEYGRLTGVEVARRIKQQRPDLPIVSLTVVRNLDMQRKLRDAGILEIINKPAEIETIVQVLLRVVRLG